MTHPSSTTSPRCSGESQLEKRMAGQHQKQLEEDAASSEDDDLTRELTLDLEGMQSAFQEASHQGELDAIGVLLNQAWPLIGQDSSWVD